MWLFVVRIVLFDRTVAFSNVKVARAVAEGRPAVTAASCCLARQQFIRDKNK
jgi:hypothetical protein